MAERITMTHDADDPQNTSLHYVILRIMQEDEWTPARKLQKIIQERTGHEFKKASIRSVLTMMCPTALRTVGESDVTGSVVSLQFLRGAGITHDRQYQRMPIGTFGLGMLDGLFAPGQRRQDVHAELYQTILLALMALNKDQRVQMANRLIAYLQQPEADDA